jgi:hypothetical protein
MVLWGFLWRDSPPHQKGDVTLFSVGECALEKGSVPLNHTKRGLGRLASQQELLDGSGFHRWRAYKTLKSAQMGVVFLDERFLPLN